MRYRLLVVLLQGKETRLGHRHVMVKLVHRFYHNVDHWGIKLYHHIYFHIKVSQGRKWLDVVG